MEIALRWRAGNLGALMRDRSPAGDVLADQCRWICPLGQGRMGAVRRAEPRTLRSEVAVKLSHVAAVDSAADQAQKNVLGVP
jgi:hypothetical protein